MQAREKYKYVIIRTNSKNPPLYHYMLSYFDYVISLNKIIYFFNHTLFHRPDKA